MSELDKLKIIRTIIMQLSTIARDMDLLSTRVERLRETMESLTGLQSHNRDPGFPCWTIDGLEGYYHSDYDAIEAKIKKEEEPIADMRNLVKDVSQ